MAQRLREQNFLADCTTRVCELPTVGPVYVFSNDRMPDIVIPYCFHNIAERDRLQLEPYIRVDPSRFRP